MSIPWSCPYFDAAIESMTKILVAVDKAGNSDLYREVEGLFRQATSDIEDARRINIELRRDRDNYSDDIGALREEVEELRDRLESCRVLLEDCEYGPGSQ